MFGTITRSEPSPARMHHAERDGNVLITLRVMAGTLNLDTYSDNLR